MAMVLVSLASGAEARASFVGGRSQWDRLPPAEKIAYAAGVYEGFQVRYRSDAATIAALKEARDICIARVGLTSSDLVKLVNDGYAQHADWWERPPWIVLSAKLAELCRDDISREQAKAQAAKSGAAPQ
jgi:hypothetical protein